MLCHHRTLLIIIKIVLLGKYSFTLDCNLCVWYTLTKCHPSQEMEMPIHRMESMLTKQGCKLRQWCSFYSTRMCRKDSIGTEWFQEWSAWQPHTNNIDSSLVKIRRISSIYLLELKREHARQPIRPPWKKVPRKLKHQIILWLLFHRAPLLGYNIKQWHL